MEEVSSESIVASLDEPSKGTGCNCMGLGERPIPIGPWGYTTGGTVLLIESISNFSLNARRALESISGRTGIKLEQPRWRWVSEN